MFKLLYITSLLLFVLAVRAKLGDPTTGVILYAEDGKTRSGLLGRDHRCTQFPQHFPAYRIKNVGSVHCTLYADNDCSSSLHIVPAHFSIDMPSNTFASIMC
ncbi:hypothetical protein BX666DRAFT_1226771 [Dichotomocladium elegans]|nr:hypothetical protein BX666DRAFT_1226771 [Dichotomocladium elegans]